jgi:hypothetical protein
MTDGTGLVRIDRPCKLQFTIDSIANNASLPEPFSIYIHTRGACASSNFSRPKVKGKIDPKNPAVEPVTLLCDVWWRPATVNFACCEASAGVEFPVGDAVLAFGRWDLLPTVECSGQSSGPDCDFSIELSSPNGAGDAALIISGKVCAVWDELVCEGAMCVGDVVDGLITAAIAAHDDKRLDALASDLSASVSVMHCLSTIDILSTAHELFHPLPPPDADCPAPPGDVHMRGVLPVVRRPASASLKVNVADAHAASITKALPLHSKPPSVKNTPREAGDTDASARPPLVAALPLQYAAQPSHARPATAHPSRKQNDAQLSDLDDGLSLHSGLMPRSRIVCACYIAVTFPADSSEKRSRPKSAPIKKAP